MPGGRLDGVSCFLSLIGNGVGFWGGYEQRTGLDLPIMVAKTQAQYCVSMVPASLEDVTAAKLLLMPMKV